MAYIHLAKEKKYYKGKSNAKTHNNNNNNNNNNNKYP